MTGCTCLVLQGRLLDGRDEQEAEPELQAIIGLVSDRQALLRTEARKLADRIYVEKPRELGRRMAKYWEAWRRWEQPLSDVAP
jgi:hypothetical protein